jgi:peptidoglycan/xylan/chitin deacetylase (PgdA/CDA1 family)
MRAEMTRKLLILEYHRISETGPARLLPWRITPEIFRSHLHSLAVCGLPVVTVESWLGGSDVHPASVAITFDDAYQDFADEALPLLRHYGFPATVYVPTDYVDGRAEWNANAGPPAPLMGWNSLERVVSHGVALGGHSCSHIDLTNADDSRLVDELSRSKSLLESRLGVSVRGMAYPYGCQDERVRTQVTATGYEYAVTVEPGICGEGGDKTLLPRFEVLNHHVASDLAIQIEALRAQRPPNTPLSPLDQ